MMAKAIERLEEYRVYKGWNIAEAERSLGMSNGYFKKQLTRGSDLGEGVMVNVLENCPELSPLWLLTGEGNMLKEDTISFQNSKTTSQPDVKAIGEFKTKDKLVELQAIPLYEIEATAGLFAQGDLSQYTIDYISIPNSPRCDGAIVARGDSMAPIIKSGDILLYKEQEVSNIIYGHMYLIDFDMDGESMLVIKYIQKVEDDPSQILLTSENPRYQPMAIALTQVRHIALVKVSVSYHTIS